MKELLKRDGFYVTSTEAVQLGAYQFYPNRQELVFKEDAKIRLSHKEIELLLLLAKNRIQILDRTQTLLKLWGDDHSFNLRTMDVFITKLRKHLKADPTIESINIRGYGYKLIV